jgi:hypothetical protein
VLSAGIHIVHNGVVVGGALSSRSCRPAHIFGKKKHAAAIVLKSLNAWHYNILFASWPVLLGGINPESLLHNQNALNQRNRLEAHNRNAKLLANGQS